MCVLLRKGLHFWVGIGSEFCGLSHGRMNKSFMTPMLSDLVNAQPSITPTARLMNQDVMYRKLTSTSAESGLDGCADSSKTELPNFRRQS